MKRFVLLIAGILLLQVANAGVEFHSFYFEAESHRILSGSDEELTKFIEMIKEHEFQVIELNGFCVSGENEAENTRIANDYITYINNKIDFADKSQLTINNYGGNMIKVNFTPRSWDRVDVYYYIGGEVNVKPDLIITDDYSPESDTPVDEKTEASASEIIMNTPIVMPIHFVGGKTKVKEESYKYMDNLYKVLSENPELYAHIRGHVCCGHKRIQSKLRARSVYKYLVKKGIDKNRLSCRGYANHVPLVFPEITEEDRRANRRVDVIFTTYKGRRLFL